MANGEPEIQTAIQDTLQAISAFDDADVVINDWGVLDQSKALAPYVIIESADDFISRQDAYTPDTNWEIPLRLIENFTDWKVTLDNLTTRRQAIIDEFNEVGTNRAPSSDGTMLVQADVIRNDGPIIAKYDPNISREMLATAMPDYLEQRLILEVRVR